MRRNCAILLCLLVLMTGCRRISETPGATPPTPATLFSGTSTSGPLALTHGGAGSPPTWSVDCDQAAATAAATLSDGGTALDAAVAGVVVLENIPRFNAGTGANIRLDGRTIQMDAAVMTSDDEFAAVAAIERVRNPILVARAVLDTPHRMLAGDGATRFAHAMGFADEVPVCPEAEAKFRRRLARLLRGEAGGGYDDFDWRRAWNFPTPVPSPADTLIDDPEIGDTVGTVTRAADGSFAAALSTGGTSITLYGRVGDVPIYGCGCFAGPAGAVACTGHGEEIIRQGLGRKVYGLLAAGHTAREAVRSGIADFPASWTVGVIAVAADGWAVAANTQMAYGVETIPVRSD